jgi:beta-lactam-binding protein with PASTA domain
VLAGAGCGSNEEAAPMTVTAQQTVTEGDPLEGLRNAPNVSTMSVEEAIERMTVEVPNVVGIDHQLAQDTMQAAGLYNLAEEDATGQGRMLLWDRNWTVVSQDPPAGDMVSPDTTIVLRSKKDDE